MALEKRENAGAGAIPGVDVKTRRREETLVTRIEIRTPEASAKLEKPTGVYFTVETDGFPDLSSLCGERQRVVTEILRELLPESGPVLVAGLGNPDITPDALGPRCAGMIFATRHLEPAVRRQLSLPELREVSAVSPGVTGQTGVEAVEVIDGICRKIRPAAVIAVDALAAGSVRRLARTVQISNVGIEPGAGVGNARKALNESTLGVPVIAVGVPTVVDALSLSRDFISGGDLSEENRDLQAMVVTPRDTDTVTLSAARFLALAVNCALQPALSAEDLLSLMG